MLCCVVLCFVVLCCVVCVVLLCCVCVALRCVLCRGNVALPSASSSSLVLHRGILEPEMKSLIVLFCLLLWFGELDFCSCLPTGINQIMTMQCQGWVCIPVHLFDSEVFDGYSGWLLSGCLWKSWLVFLCTNQRHNSRRCMERRCNGTCVPFTKELSEARLAFAN